MEHGLLESRDPKMNDGGACRKLPYEDHPPKGRQNRAFAWSLTGAEQQVGVAVLGPFP